MGQNLLPEPKVNNFIALFGIKSTAKHNKNKAKHSKNIKYLKALQKYCNEVLKNEGGVGGERPYATTAKNTLLVVGGIPY